MTFKRLPGKSFSLVVIAILLTVFVSGGLFLAGCGKSVTSPYRLVGIIGSKGRADGQFLSPRWLALDSENNLYVSDYENHRIEKFNPKGEFVDKWGSAGAGESEFNMPSGLAVWDKRVYIADSGNSRVQVFAVNGVFIRSWGERGTEPGQLLKPMGIAVDSNGDVFVADVESRRVQKFKPDGTFIAEIVSSAADKMLIPYGLAISKDNNLLVVDVAMNLIKIYNEQGGFVKAVGLGNDGAFIRVINVAVDDAGNIYAVDAGAQKVRKYDKNGKLTAVLGEPGEGPAQFKEPLGIAIGADDSVLVADTGNHRIQKFKL